MLWGVTKESSVIPDKVDMISKNISAFYEYGFYILGDKYTKWKEQVKKDSGKVKKNEKNVGKQKRMWENKKRLRMIAQFDQLE